MRPQGFYWVRVGKCDPEVMRFEDDRAEGLWFQTGSEDYYIGDEHIEVLSGPLEPPR